jgi:hypothetical protein
MAENEEGNGDGGMSTLKKTIIGIATTAVTAVGGYVATHIEAIFGGDKEEPKTEQVAQPAQSQPNIILNVDNSSQNNSSNGGGNTVIRERIIEKPAVEPAPKPKKEEEDPW